MSSEFPKFVEQGGKMILQNPERYKKFESKILYEDIHPGTLGNKLNSTNQLVTISYQYMAYDGKNIRKDRFLDPLAEFVREFQIKTDISKVLMGMKLLGERRIIIPPEMTEAHEYRILTVLILSIKHEKSEEFSGTSKGKPERLVVGDEETEEPKNPISESKDDNKNEKSAGYSITAIGTLAVTAAGSLPYVLQVIREIKSTISNSPLISKDTETPSPKLPLDEQIMYPPRTVTHTNITMPQPQPQPQPKPNQFPKITYKVMNEGEGEIINKYQQGCFQYKEADSTEAISFEGSPTGLALKLGPGFEEEMLEAIVGMKLKGRRMIFIPAEVSGLEEDTFVDLKLTAINPRSRI